MNSVDGGKEAVDHLIADHVQPLQGTTLDIAQPVANYVVCLTFQDRGQDAAGFTG